MSKLMPYGKPDPRGSKSIVDRDNGRITISHDTSLTVIETPVLYLCAPMPRDHLDIDFLWGRYSQIAEYLLCG